MMRPSSGIELYKQRLEALKAGLIHTQLPPDSFQSVWEGSMGHPTYEQWKILLEREAKAVAAVQGKDCLSVMLGDSLCLWFPVDLLPPGQLWLNQGIYGDNTAGILKRLSVLADNRIHDVYLMVGINDIRQGRSDATIINNLRHIVGRIRMHHICAKIFILSVLPTRLAALPNSRIGQINSKIEVLARQEGGIYIDLNTPFTDADDMLRQDFTDDGVHVNFAAYQLWQQVMEQTTSRLALQRDDRYQHWLRQSHRFSFNGKHYVWMPYQVSPGETLEEIALKTFGKSDVQHYDLIAIKNNINYTVLPHNETIYIPREIA
ncbi:GDSL-type esterase/lipase family protein [[Phormidium] sp. ETS-05]|uniref:GDSL-type esterase/lipase family protein n=1 Tax=[Phormidium] sp. ETS-05 TaxID=222819 RepID=UPI0018EEE734|nr:GDSL-type esterase/lipase family protein [[Phormidium] sp. ETS-05]